MTGRAALLPISQIVAALASRAPELARSLFANGVRDGQEWRVGSLGGEKGQSLAIHIGAGARAGVWCDFSSGDKGDALDLVAQAACAGDKAAALGWAKAWLGLDGADPAALRETRRAVEQRDEHEDIAGAIDRDKRRRHAQAIYLKAAASIIDTPVERYLAGRGLRVGNLDFPLRALRYHPALWETHTKRPWPAMVAAIVGRDGKFAGVHRTWLELQRDGRVTKAPIVNPATGKPAAKRCLGDYRGAAIRLWRGSVPHPKTGEYVQGPRLAELPAGSWVDLAEGNEDGVSVVLGCPEATVLVGVSISNMAEIDLPDTVEGVTIWKQNDQPDSQAAHGMLKAVAHFQQAGKRVRLVNIPDGVKDINEVVQGAAE